MILRSLILSVGFTVAGGVLAADAAPEDPPAVEVGSQHVILLSVSAFYYCSHGAWPTSLPELLAYKAEKKVLTEKTLNEAWALSSALSYRTAPSYEVRSSGLYEKEGRIKVVSRQEPPTCGPRSTKINDAHVDFVPN